MNWIKVIIYFLILLIFNTILIALLIVNILLIIEWKIKLKHELNF